MRPLLLLLAFALASCDALSPSFGCTAEYVVLDTEVVDALGRPVPGLASETVNLRTGETLVQNETVRDHTPFPPGRYVLATDSDAGGLRVDGDPVRFTATGQGLTATADFVLAFDGCHIARESGPDQVVAR